MRPIRALTWNVHGFVGQDGRFDPERVLRIIADLKPDIAAVQEVVGPECGVDGFALLRDAIPDAEAMAANVNRRIAGIYGQMLLSRLPVRSSRNVDLSVRRREPRRAIDALVQAPAGPMRIVATHLGLAGHERRHQIGVLCGLIDSYPDLDTLVLGDINDWRRGGVAERGLAPLLGPGTRHRTFPSAFPVFPLDRIWFRPRQRLLRADVVREAGLASDHLPMIADIAPGVPAAPAANCAAPAYSPRAAASTSST